MRIPKIPAALLFSMSLFSVATFSPAAHALPSLHYCRADAARLCKGIQPGGGRIIKCLKAHENDITVGCAKELRALKGMMKK